MSLAVEALVLESLAQLEVLVDDVLLRRKVLERIRAGLFSLRPRISKVIPDQTLAKTLVMLEKPIILRRNQFTPEITSHPVPDWALLCSLIPHPQVCDLLVPFLKLSLRLFLT